MDDLLAQVYFLVVEPLADTVGLCLNLHDVVYALRCEEWKLYQSGIVVCSASLCNRGILDLRYSCVTSWSICIGVFVSGANVSMVVLFFLGYKLRGSPVVMYGARASMFDS